MTDAEYAKLYKKVVDMYARQGRPFRHYKRLYWHFGLRNTGYAIHYQSSYFFWEEGYEIGIP